MLRKAVHLTHCTKSASTLERRVGTDRCVQTVSCCFCGNEWVHGSNGKARTRIRYVNNRTRTSVDVAKQIDLRIDQLVAKESANRQFAATSERFKIRVVASNSTPSTCSIDCFLSITGVSPTKSNLPNHQSYHHSPTLEDTERKKTSWCDSVRV
jgi:uncharacterized protein involved in outer membrane biogenesis